MIAWLWSPFGRALAAVGAILGALMAVYLKGRREGVQELERQQNEAAQDRLRRAMRAAGSIDADRLREPDENQRK